MVAVSRSMSSSASSSRSTNAGLGPVGQLVALAGDALAIVVEFGREPEMLIARLLELTFQPPDGLPFGLHRKLCKLRLGVFLA